MNPTWELLPLEQLCRMLARKTGQEVLSYHGWTRDKLKTELEKYEGTDTVTVKEVASLNDAQLRQVKEMLLSEMEEQKNANKASIDSRFLAYRQDVLDAIASTRRVEHKYIVLDKRKDPPTENKLGRQHMDFEVLLNLMNTGQNIFFVGPAGSGKTMAAMNAAKALGLKFYFNGAIDSEYKLLGFTDAQGRVVHRPFREAYTQGGVYLFDEVDASLPSAVLAFNAALANDVCDFPDICAQRHPNFLCLAAGNTFYGADHQYVGRMKQDAAFLDRFLVLDWHYDLELEMALAFDLWPENHDRAKKWYDMVVKTRNHAASLGMQIVVSPRATIGGVKILRAGMDWKTAVRVTIRKTMKEADWQKIEPVTHEAQARPSYTPPPEPVKPQAASATTNPSDPSYDPPWYKQTSKPKFVVKSHGHTKKKFNYDDLL